MINVWATKLYWGQVNVTNRRNMNFGHVTYLVFKINLLLFIMINMIKYQKKNIFLCGVLSYFAGLFRKTKTIRSTRENSRRQHLSFNL